MGLKTEHTTIGENEYSVMQWNATKAMVMKLKVAKYLGGLFGVIAKDPQNIQKVLMENIGDILDDVDEVAFITFIKEVACSAVRNNEKMNVARFDEYFNGNILESYELAFFVLKVNYEDFLSSVLSLRNEK